MRVFGLIGYPLSHSFSKKYFSEKFEREAITDCEYELFPIESIQSFPLLLKNQPQLIGLNVTIPYKESVIPYLTQLSTAVQDIKACNCIKISAGAIIGYNTDVIGFERSLKPLLKPSHKKALILGTGGAAKAVSWVLKQLDIDYQLVSRNAGENVITYEQLAPEVFLQFSLIINTTPVGMQPNVGQFPSLPYELINQDFLCYDLIYNPLKTEFLRIAEEKGAVIKNGLEMLEIQAEESWKIWNAGG